MSTFARQLRAGPLRGETDFWLAAAVLGGALSAMKGLRRPNLWAATGLQIDYSQGFIKRGLVGQVLESAHLPVGRLLFVQAFSGIVALALAVLLGVMVWRGARRDRRFAVAAAVFASSAAPAYMGHLLGYPDILLASIATSLVLVPVGRWRLALLAASSAMAILAHEEYLLLFLPLTFLPDGLAALRRGGSPASTAVALAPAAVVAGLAGATALLLSAARPLSPERMAALLHRQAAQADFPLRADEFDVLVRSAADNVAVTFHYPFWGDNLAGLLMFAPSAAILLVWAWGGLADVPGGWWRTMARAAVLAVVAAPLLMHAIGWDHFRWDAWALFDAFVSLYVVRRGAAPRAEDSLPMTGLSETGRWGVLLLVLLNMGTGGGFMDGRTPRLFPYTEGWTGWPHPPAAAQPPEDGEDDEQAEPADATKVPPSRPPPRSTPLQRP